jgi:bacterioferritin
LANHIKLFADADREEVLRLLNESLATELVCVLSYKRHYFMANGLKAQVAADEFLEHATQEAQHAERIAIDSNREIIQYIGEKDPTTRRIFEDILTQEEEHADDMADILKDL